LKYSALLGQLSR